MPADPLPRSIIVNVIIVDALEWDTESCAVAGRYKKVNGRSGAIADAFLSNRQ
jgi:hypothetical protein